MLAYKLSKRASGDGRSIEAVLLYMLQLFFFLYKVISSAMVGSTFSFSDRYYLSDPYHFRSNAPVSFSVAHVR